MIINYLVQGKNTLKYICRIILLSMVFQIIFPAVSFALTTGPSQPEVQGFEPVGTTDMVEMFTGDFTYNIPLMDVEGYPINISYHGGIGMEQEASWVGLGWNINAGVLNRAVRGIPDDFNGEEIKKEFSIKDEKNIRVGMGGGVELAGVGDPALSLNLSLGANVNVSNYRGVSCDFNLGCGVNLFKCVSAGVNLGVGSQTGADIDVNAGLSLSSSQIVSTEQAGGIGVNVGTGYNTRSGMKDLSFSVGTSMSLHGAGFRGASFETSIPIGVRNFVPVITNKSSMKTYYGRLKVGGEVYYVYPYGNINGMYSVVKHSDEEATRKSFGYLYAQNGNDPSAIHDFTRDRDGLFNKKMEYLPLANMTYDIYSASGQGTGGNFRPFRNDFGSVGDAAVSSDADNFSMEFEAGLGNIFELGFDGKMSKTDITYGPWSGYAREFQKNTLGSSYENTYFKQGGDLAAIDESYFNTIGGYNALSIGQASALPAKKPNSATSRDIRSNLFYYLNAYEASMNEVSTSSDLKSYTSTNGFATGPATSVTSINRNNNGIYGRRGHQISEVTQLQTDGTRYVYGIPAMNHVQREATFSIGNPANPNDIAAGMVSFTPGADDSKNNTNGIDNYYSASITPSFAHSYLLTSVLSADYADVTGDGPTDDDLGSYTRMNYTLKEDDYRWRAPYESNKAQYNPGYMSDTKDDKASYLIGSREQWYMHSIESKNFIAEFYVSPRNDGKGSNQGIASAPGYTSTQTDTAKSYKLDSIKLYNKHDRFINTTSAIPVKTVIFEYDYSLCRGIPNVINPTGNPGKLTLKKIYTKYGNSNKSLMSPYQFEYNDYNPDYNLSEKDRWGGYKPNNPALNNYIHPYVNQTDDSLDYYASAWCMERIQLPSGGAIEVQYESDDYAYVQDRVATEMTQISGFGKDSKFNGGNELYKDIDKDKENDVDKEKRKPMLFLYFPRRISEENANLSFKDNYFKGQEYLFYSCYVNLREGKYEQIRGYTQMLDVGICPNNSDYGYIEMDSFDPEKAGKTLVNPITLTAMNVGRYNIPHVFFPGSDPGQSGIKNVLAGLKQSFSEMASLFRNPIVGLLKKNYAKQVSLSRSFVRLNSPGMKKKGGGQRVKQLTFYDNWNQLAGADEQDATYGKTYDYTIENEDGFGGVISSGVASYEPMIGADENPMRNPIKFLAQSGSKFPPSDPIELFQETPIGESLYPPGQVGYRKVSVKSIHSDVARSAQGIDVFEFYTAKDFPVTESNTPISVSTEKKLSIRKQRNAFKGTQGYTLVMNDMHGKPKSVKNLIHKPQGSIDELVNSKEYIYYASNGKLENSIPVMVWDAPNKKIVRQNKLLGLESDVTIDTRHKMEHTYNDNFNFSLNVVLWGPYPVPLPWFFYWDGEYENEFYSAVSTKVIQQYGIVKEIRSNAEGAITTVRNEAFDPVTGSPIITSVDNEFRDKEYSASMPAYWAYRNMGGAYKNIGFEDKPISAKTVNYYGYLDVVDHEKYEIGDELLMYAKDTNNNPIQFVVWVTGMERVEIPSVIIGPTVYPPTYKCYMKVLPRLKYSTPGWPANDTLNIRYVKVIRSGYRNMLDASVQSYTGLDNPVDGSNTLKLDYLKTIDVNANTFTYGNQFLSVYGNMNYATPSNIVTTYSRLTSDSINPFVVGTDGIIRSWKSFVNLKNRDYSGSTIRQAGIYEAKSYWAYNNSFYSGIIDSFGDLNKICSFNGPYLVPANAPNWVFASNNSKFTPWSQQVESMDALKNYSSAYFGYNEDLSVAVSQNARHGEVLFDGFEDFALLQTASPWLNFDYSPFRQLFSKSAYGGSTVYKTYNLTSGTGAVVSNARSHTGYYSLKTPSTPNNGTYSNYFTLEVNTQNYATYVNVNKEYFPFRLNYGKKYLVSYWVKPVSAADNLAKYTLQPYMFRMNGTYSTMKYKSNIIDGWQQVEAVVSVHPSTNDSQGFLFLPLNCYVDDIRIFPMDANMKSFVYHPVNEKLAASLDENNFATFYEYDQEGNLVRTKKETEKGIMTISESRSEKRKQ